MPSFTKRSLQWKEQELLKKKKRRTRYKLKFPCSNIRRHPFTAIHRYHIVPVWFPIFQGLKSGWGASFQGYHLPLQGHSPRRGDWVCLGSSWKSLHWSLQPGFSVGLDLSLPQYLDQHPTSYIIDRFINQESATSYTPALTFSPTAGA